MTKSLTTKRDGYKFAIAALKEIEAVFWEGGERCCIQAKYRSMGVPQDDVMGRYIAKLKTSGNDAAMAGFTTMLTEVISNQADNLPEDYYQILERVANAPDKVTGPGIWDGVSDFQQAI
jgi:hypothetical protein